MAGTDPYQDALERPRPQGSLEDRYSPLRQPGYQSAPPALPAVDPEFERFMEALRLQAEDFNIPDLPDSSPAAEPDAAYEPPKTLDEAKAALDAADKALNARRSELDAFAQETRGIIPISDESSREVIRRAQIIAQSRRDLAKNSEALAFSRTELEQAGVAAAEDPAWWQEALGVAGKTVGAIGWLMEHSPLAGIGETLGGITSYSAERLGKLLGTTYAKSGVNEGTFLEQLRDSPISPTTWFAATGLTPDSDVRRRGREFFKQAGASLGSFEKEYILTTPVLREYWNFKDYIIPVRPALEGMAILGKMAGDKTGQQRFGPLSAVEKDAVRDQSYELGLQLMTDPLNLVDFGAPLTRLGQLRKLGKANAGALEVAAVSKTLQEVPEIGARLGQEAFEAARSGELVTSLRKAGVTGEEAEALAKRFDQARKTNFKDLRELASVDPQAWGATVRQLVVDAPGKGTIQHSEMLKALDRIAEFGDDVDPILGRTWREQASLGQRAKVWQKMYSKFGDKPWFKAMGKPWAVLTGQSLLHDIGDNPELLDLYFSQRMFKADAGAEILRYQQDVNGRVRDILNDLNKAEQADLFEQLPRVVEHVSPEARKALREGMDAEHPLKSALLDMADLYDESAETLKAIQNRFGLKVADLSADIGYFGRQFSPELQDWLLRNPSAREFLFGDKVKKSREYLSTAFLPEEKARKLKEFDFAESEAYLRERFREYGLPDNVNIWSRDAFGNLAARARKTLHTAEKRNLFSSFAEAHAAQIDPSVAGAASDDILDLINARVGKQQGAAFKKFTDAQAELDAALKAQEDFRAGRAAVRKAGYEARRAAEPLGASKANLGGVAGQAEEVKFADKAGAAMGRTAPVEGEDVMRRFVEEARAKLKSLEGKGFAGDVARRAQKASDEYAAEIQRIQDKWWADNPGAIFPRDADEYVAGVVDQYRQAVKRLASKLDGIAPPGLRKEMDRLHQQALRQLDAFEEGQRAVAKNVAESINKRVREAKARHKAAHQAAKDAGVLSDKERLAAEAASAKAQAGDLGSKARSAEEVAAEQEKYAAQVKAEMGAAEKRYREKVADFQAKGGEYAKAAADYKKAKSDYFDAQAAKGAAKEAANTTAESAADAAMRDATQRQLKAHEALKKAKGTGTATPAELNKLQKDVADADAAYKAAKDAAAEPVAKAQQAREAANRLAAESRKAEENFKRVQAELEAARAAMMKNHPDFWTAEQKADWLLKNLKAKGKLSEYGPGGRQINALEVLLKSKITPPSDWEELARYAATNLNPKDAEEFSKLANGLYWRDFEKAGWLGKAYDSLKAIYQRTTLARIPSLAKDLFGTSVNGIMAGNVGYWDRAMKELGTFKQWRDPAFRKGANANRLTALGVLKTTKGEALEQVGALEELLPSFVGKAAGRVEKYGVVGAAAGKEVGGALGTLNEARQYWEELNRVATYLKSLDEGADLTSAVNDVYKWWGKFDEVSKLERNTLNRVLFFWSWMARSVPISVAHLFEHPVRSKLLLNMMAGNVDDDSKTPNWLRRMGGWVLGQGENGVARSINLGGSTYFSPTFAMLQGDFGNQMMHGKPLSAVSGALRDLGRATPPFVQAIGELAQKSDYFTQKDWWKDKNAETGSNAKAPTALWWLYAEPGSKGGIAALSDLLGLKPVLDPKTGEATHLTMNPSWAWFFGSLPGVEPLLTDVSAFFTPPKGEGTINARPELDLKKGLLRQAGFPVYDVPMDTAKTQIYEFRKALTKSADGLSGSALYIDSFGRVSPSKSTWRGQKMRADLDSWEAKARAQGATAAQAKAAAMDKAKLVYPNEWRILTLQDRLEAWTAYVNRIEEGGDEVSKALKVDIEQLARRADYSRTQRYQDRKNEALLPKELRR